MGHVQWYVSFMSGTNTVVVGDRGRIVIPTGVRRRTGLTEGTPLIMLETPDGLVLLTREQLRARVRRDLDGLDLVSDLLAERRRAAVEEDGA